MYVYMLKKGKKVPKDGEREVTKIQRKRERYLKKNKYLPISIHSLPERGGGRGPQWRGERYISIQRITTYLLTLIPREKKRERNPYFPPPLFLTFYVV